MGRSTDRRLHRSERGASLVEFAFVLPVLLMLLVGIVTSAQARNIRNSHDHAVPEAARIGATIEPWDAAAVTWVRGVVVQRQEGHEGGRDSGRDHRRAELERGLHRKREHQVDDGGGRLFGSIAGAGMVALCSARSMVPAAYPSRWSSSSSTADGQPIAWSRARRMRLTLTV